MKFIETGDGSPTLFSSRYKESFHSTFGAATESRYVFLECSGVYKRLEAGLATSVLEIGFGLGLNTLLTCDLASAHNTSLEYHSFENDPSIRDLIKDVDYSALLTNPNLASRLVEQISSSSPLAREAWIQESTAQDAKFPATDTGLTGEATSSGEHLPDSIQRLNLADNQTVCLHWADVTQSKLPRLQFDAIYLDAFSPDSNQECWSEKFFAKLFESLNPGGNLSTYCAKGVVRRAMQAVGFDVQKHPGPPGKREIVVAKHPLQF